MRIYRPGLPVTYVGEKPPKVAVKKEGKNPLPSIAEAMARAQARQTQILEYTRPSAPLVNATPNGPGHPHSVNDKPEVQK